MMAWIALAGEKQIESLPSMSFLDSHERFIMLTQSQLKELIHYCQETGEFTWVKEIGKRAMTGNKAGHLHHSGYVHITIKRRIYAAHRLAWLYVYGSFPNLQIDHINRIKNDNRINNLRQVIHKQNQQNRGVQKNNTSGHKGVYWNKQCKKWTVALRVYPKQIYLGIYERLDDAISAYQAGIEKHHTHHPLTNKDGVKT